MTGQGESLALVFDHGQIAFESVNDEHWLFTSLSLQWDG
jgi:hypothetical protein